MGKLFGLARKLSRNADEAMDMEIEDRVRSGSQVDRRSRRDRRRRPTPMLAALSTPGRRRGFRRASEGVDAYVDLPSSRIITWALAVMLLSATDALLTILHVRAGGEELIPTMRYALDCGEGTFTAVKMSVTALGVLFLAIHENFRVVRLGFRLLLGCYAALMAYHILLIALR